MLTARLRLALERLNPDLPKEAINETIEELILDRSRGFQGKAMVICIDKATAVLMHDKVRKHWDRKLETLRKQHRRAHQVDRPAFEQRIREMAETDMAVVISQTQNEIHDLKEKGLDIRPHRKRMLNEDLETHFKDPEHPFRLVFVCAMWMTGSPADISDVMQQVEDLLDSSIAAEGYVIREPSGEYGTDHRIDLSGIDFEALKERFEQGRKHTEAERRSRRLNPGSEFRLDRKWTPDSSTVGPKHGLRRSPEAVAQ